MRIERCIRPSDQLCLLGGARVAVCLGSGSHRVAPAALGRRLARALEDRFAFGDSGLGLDIAIGIGVDTSPGAAGPTALAQAAMSSVRRSPGGRRAAPPAFATVTWLPGPDPLAGGTTNGALGAGQASWRLRHRALVALHDDVWRADGAFLAPGAGATLEPVASWEGLAACALDVLVVDPDSATSVSGPLVDLVAELTRRSGARSVMSTAADVEGILLELGAHKPDVVVLALGAEGGRHDPDRDPNLAWEGPGRVARAIRDMGTPVIALSMGASAAALAVCVEQGAIGLFHSELLSQELARQASRRFVHGNGNGNGNGAAYDEPRGPGQLPPPYHALVRLTPSERRVLFHMMEGRAAAEIATTLVVSLTTVRSHIRSILRKLNVNSQLAAVALAFGTITDTGAAD
jgi:DNA-binding NarL/FixJ family response regulator